MEFDKLRGLECLGLTGGLRGLGLSLGLRGLGVLLGLREETDFQAFDEFDGIEGKVKSPGLGLPLLALRPESSE